MTAFAFVFPGQGSQSVGMLNDWEGHAAVRDTLAEASDALGEDIGRLIAEGPKEALDLTTNTQPVMLTAGVACLRAWFRLVWVAWLRSWAWMPMASVQAAPKLLPKQGKLLRPSTSMIPSKL